MKKILFWLPALVLLVGVSSCKEDDNDMDGPYRSWVTVYSNDNTPTFVTDKKLFLHATNAQPDSTFYEVGDRGSVVYTLVDLPNQTGASYPIVMSEFIKATVKPFVDDTSASYRDTKLAAFSSGIVSGDYLNVLVKLFDSDDKMNTLELVRYPDEETHLDTDSLPVIRVRLQHNVGTVKSTQTTKAVCFNLTRLKNLFPGKGGYVLRFSWKSANDEQEYDLRYVPSPY